MTTETTDYLWNFNIKDLGPLKNGKVSLKPLTLFCGPNNTGKTWLMYALYGFFSSQGPTQIPGVKKIVATLQSEGQCEIDLKEWLEEHLKQTLKAINNEFSQNLSDIFNVNSEIFENVKFESTAEMSGLLSEVKKSGYSYEMRSSNSTQAVLEVSKKVNSYKIQATLLDQVPESVLQRAMSKYIYRVLMRHDSTFLIPAERNGLHLFYRELSNRRTALLHHASAEKFSLEDLLKDVLSSKYAKPIANYIDWLNSLPEIKRKQGKKTLPEFRSIARELKKLIDGSYEVDSEGNISFTPRKKRNSPKVAALDLHISSSTVKSLFGLWFFLEYQAEPNSVLMIDEPELNLHPSNQRAIVKIIARMVNAGIFIIFSTHSDYIVRELNALLMLGDHEGNQEQKDALMKKFSISKDHLLKEKQVAAYVFSSDSVELMEYSDEGVIADTFDKEITTLNSYSDDIYYNYVVNEE